MPSRSEVYQAIDSERDYQERKWVPDSSMSIAEAILYMEQYLDFARFDATTNNESPLENIRKVVAIGVACMEQHGAPLREKRNNKNE